ncbi:hypothetical protein BGW36DRAFT_387354 [Talaromyces proteolyticus]|uniref:Transcription factor domain-containing protein n=1 Tax=Talaromyces proteolyticus TaxID=1131652 RepID=A0AAD4PWD4_9EURO|nr:uncharacterized protein BGW36DRAFT_387354 [Talaromyces proteolyticus]KAH8692308.1 hypothetical protein BGW36DRAFT_387354 [Talaromyces proteolyticus]
MMASENPGKIQFIHSLHPRDALKPDSQRRAHVHAARVSHARRRHFRIIEYQAGQNSRITANEQQSNKKGDCSGPRSKGNSPPGLETSDVENLVAPSPVTQLASHRIDPFASSARRFSPVENFLFDCYVQAIIPDQSVHCYCHTSWNPEQFRDLMTREWVPLAIARQDTLDCIFLNACRLLSLYHPQESEQQQYYTQLATMYKLSCMQALNKSISAEISILINDATVATAVMLAFDEVLLGDIARSRCHALGILQMARHNGGFQTLGLSGFLAGLFHKLWGTVQDTRPSSSNILIGV